MQHGKTWVESQGGPGFPLQTRVLAADTSCYMLSEAGGILHMDIAVSLRVYVRRALARLMATAGAKGPPAVPRVPRGRRL
jgi:hypothetical protein